MRSPATLTALAVAALVTVVLLTRGDDRYVVRAEFGHAAGLRKHSEVQVDGLRVGEVSDLRLTETDAVVAVLRIDDAVAPIGRDARALIRSKNLLGAKLVDLQPGDVARPAPSGFVIGQARTDTPVDLDEVLAVLDSDTRTRLRILINETGAALTGRGRDFRRLLEALPGSLDATTRMIDDFASDTDALDRLLTQTHTVVASIARERAPLGRLIDTATGALAVTASRHRELGETIRRAPGTLAQLRATLTDLDATAAPLRPAAVALEDTAAPLTAVLEELPRLQGDAVSTLEAAHDAAPSLSQIGTAATPLVRRLRPTSERLRQFATSLDPVSTTLDIGTEDILRAVEGWSRATQTRDGLSHVFRGTLVLSPAIARSLVKRFVAPAGRHGSRTPAHRPVPAAPRPSVGRPQAPAPQTSIGGIKLDLPDRLPVLPQVQKVVDDSDAAVNDLLDYLLKP